MAKKKIVYLFGSGATQAVFKAIDPGLSSMTVDIQDKIRQKYSAKTLDNKIWNELINVSDIEHLISVLETQHNYSASEKIKKYYREALIDLVINISKNPPQKNLYSVLVDLHKNIKDLQEELICIITLNYEDILERTIESHFNYKINYSIHPDNLNTSLDSIKILKLHGSFNWVNTRPVSVKSMIKINSTKSLWIPPGVDKRKDNYPFNILWGQAVESLMRCNTLRIVGCSLSRNDWGLIPILYTIQKFKKDNSDLVIEIIDYPSTAQNISSNYKYLKFKTLTDIPELIYFFKKLFPKSSSAKLIGEINNKFYDKDKSNPFLSWLEAKIDYLINDKKIDIKTPPTNIVYNFYNKI